MPRLTPVQTRALRSADPRSGGVTAHQRTILSLCALGYLEPITGWYQKSIARRVGRYGATTTCWGVIGHRITPAGRAAINA